MAVEAGEIARQEPRLALAMPAGRHHEHVVAGCLSKSVDADGHGDEMEQTKNAVKGLRIFAPRPLPVWDLPATMTLVEASGLSCNILNINHKF